MKTKIIDILNKIANGEEPPKKIVYDGFVYTYNNSRNDYETYIDKFEREYLFDEYIVFDILNEPVEILETTITYKPDKIEKLKFDMSINFIDQFTDKINEIIEVLNER